MSTVMEQLTQHTLGLVGQGLIYEEVKRLVELRYHTLVCSLDSTAQQLAACEVLVYCSDTWSPLILQELNQRCLHMGITLLPVYTQFDEALIGPCVRTQHKGCATCAEARKLGATASEALHELYYQYLFEHRTLPTAQPWLSSFSLAMLAALVEQEIRACLVDAPSLRTDCALLALSLETLACHRHPFLPYPACPDCGMPVDDVPELATITLQSCPKPHASIYRTSQPTASTAQILSTYLDPRTGLVCSLVAEDRNLLPTVLSQLYAEVDEHAETATGTGCTLCPADSKLVAVLEAIERYAGLRPRAKYTMVQASYHQLVQQGQLALDVTTLGLHDPAQSMWQQQDQHCRSLIPYDPDRVCRWVWGYSFLHQAPLLVPEHCAYYGVPISAENPAFVFDVSNGCALGHCLEEAIFHGMLEVIERDAFLLTWYAQLGIPRLDLTSVTDPLIRLLVEHLQYHSGYTLYAWNMTLDHALPCIWLLAVDEHARTGMPKAHVATGSHPYPEQALLRALRELTAVLSTASDLLQEHRSEALEMLADANLVQIMDQHPLVYYLPEAFERFQFLYHAQPPLTFPQAFMDAYQHPSSSLDLCDDLVALIRHYLQHNVDVIVVEQTAPEYLPCGLRCAKVIMPGLLPMTFGQQNRRITGLERLYRLPLALGYHDHPLTPAEVNPYPHPFF